MPSKCYSQDFTSCANCCDELQRDGAIELNGEHYHESCALEVAEYCENCSDLAHSEDGHWHEEDECFYRYDCREHMRRSAPPVDRRNARFVRTADVAYGIALETSDGNDGDCDWSAEYDGSTSGSEFVSPVLLGDGAQGLQQVRRVCDQLNHNAVRVNRSCGFHLHVDASQASVEHIAKFSALRCALEDWTFSLLPPSRQSNQYSKRVDRCPDDWRKCDAKDKIADKVYGIAKHNQRIRYANERYYALNLHSWFYRETIEIRCHSGATNHDKVSAWVILWTRLFRWSESAEWSSIAHSADDVEETLRRAGIDEETIAYLRRRKEKFRMTASE